MKNIYQYQIYLYWTCRSISPDIHFAPRLPGHSLFGHFHPTCPFGSRDQMIDVGFGLRGWKSLNGNCS